MLPNKKMDLWDNQNEEAVVTSSEPHVVVGCPSCKTKFAVEGSLIATFETPRFHCSRCDAVFESAPAPSSRQHAAGGANEARWVLDDPSNSIQQTPSSHKTPAKQEESLLKPSDFSLGNPQPVPSASFQPLGRQPFGPIEERSGLSLLGLNLSATWLSPASLTREATKVASTPQTEPEADNQDPFSLFDTPNEPATLVEAQPAPTPPTPSATNLDTTSSKPVRTKQHNKTPVVPEPAQAKANEAPIIPQQKVRANVVSSGLNRLSYRNYSLTVLSSPIVLTIAVLTILAYSSRLMPQTADSLLQSVVPALISGKTSQVPPSELSVRDLSLEFTRTQSREVIGVVRGVVHNTTNQTLDDVQLEAFGFDARGEIVTRAQAPLRSALAREKISDLPLGTVKKFQESLSARSAKIGAGEKVAFVIAFVDPEGAARDSVDLSQIKYFSARVFSVSNQ